jgi:aflatoxin B1 aldehyde reductase
MGLMTLGPDASRNARITDLNDFKTALDIFQERGHTELDTARVYGGGTQEGFTRQAGWKERGLSIATKLYPLSPGMHKPEVIIRDFETSLKELGTDSVDVCVLSLLSN